MKVKLLLLIVLLVGGGCTTWGQDERADLLASQKTFAAVVRSLTAMRMNGQLGDDEVDQVDFLIDKSQMLLDNWTMDVLEDRESIYKVLFKDAITKLLEIRKGAES